MKLNWKFHKHYLFLDLEATCAQNNGFARNERETIEIGAVILDAEQRVISEFQEYIRPVVHTELTAFCTELTGITQSQVDTGAFFPHVFARFEKWVNSYDDVFIFSWGNYDRKQLLQDSRRHAVPYNLPKGFLDFKNLFYKKQKLLKRSGLGATLTQVGLEFEGRPHSALSDAKNTARLAKFVMI